MLRKNNHIKNVGKEINEGTKKPSSILNSQYGNLYEWYDEECDANVMEAMHAKATKLQSLVEQQGHFIRVTNIKDEQMKYGVLKYFSIEDTSELNEGKSYTIYQIGDDVYFRKSSEFYQLLQDKRDGIKGVRALKESYDNSDVKLDSISKLAHNDCMFVVTSIYKSITGLSELNEKNCKIRRPRLQVNGDYVSNSEFYDEVAYGDSDENKFKDDLDKKCQKYGVENPMMVNPDQQENASFKPMLPNVHNVISEGRTYQDYDVIYEAGDNVLYNDAPAIVLEVSQDNATARIQTQDGKKMVSTNDIEPDPQYLDKVSIEDNNDEELNDPEKIDTSDMNDLSQKTIDCNIIVDGYKMNMFECKASLSDVMKSRDTIRVIFENDDVQEFDKDNIEFVERPYAVIVDSNGKPVRTIQIDPTSYINADESEMVACTIGGKDTQFPKSSIKILS